MSAAVRPPSPALRTAWVVFAASLAFLTPGPGYLDSTLLVGCGVNDSRPYLWVTTPGALLRTSAPCGWHTAPDPLPTGA